jgi:archaellum component FlaC
METVITRDTDILREYLVALDARERGLSPFARLAATVKLARLRRELDATQLETTAEDIAALRREIDERMGRTFTRRFESRPWGARLSVFLLLVLGQQLVLALIMVAAMLFVRFAPVPKRWNPVLPHEDPGYLLVFIFFFFFATPMLALLVLFGGRYFHSWRKTLPATAVIFALSILGTYLVLRNNEKTNPVRHLTSLEQFAKDREINVTNYRAWVEANWLMNDAKFQRDYESYLRNGPGRWITSRIHAGSNPNNTDAAWKSRSDNDALQVMGEYVDGGQDPDGFREWLAYYLDRNRIYSEDRIDQEVNAMVGVANQRFLGIWQVEPYLKERDQRLYRSYLGSINTSMKWYGMACLALFALVFLVIYLTGPALSFWERMAGNVRGRGKQQSSFDSVESAGGPGRVTRLRERYYSFPERSEITTPPFFDTPFKLLSRVHRSFVRLAVLTTLLVFCFWGFVYALDLSAGHESVPSQIALMRSHLLLGSSSDNGANDAQGTARLSSTYTTVGRTPVEAEYGPEIATDKQLTSRVGGLEQQIDESNYQDNKRFKEQYKVLASQDNDLNSLKSLTAQLQQTTTGLPEQISQAGSQAEAKAGQAIGEAAAARQMAQGVEQQINTKLKDLENRASSATQDASNAEAQTSGIRTRTEKLETEVLNLTKQLEERTAELNNRSTKESEEQLARLDRLQRVAFAAILSEIRSNVDEMERRVNSSFYRSFNKGEASRDVEALKQRITGLTNEMRTLSGDQAKPILDQLEALANRVEQISARVK